MGLSLIHFAANGTHWTWINWIYICTSSSKLSILVNGSPQGYFSAYCGLRQGDPLLSYLFALAMKGLSSAIKKGVLKKMFTPMQKMNRCPLTHLMFADDILVFGKGNQQPLSFIRDILYNYKFEIAAGLGMSKDKSKVYLGGKSTQIKEWFYQKGIPVEQLSGKYLGFLLINKRFGQSKCQALLSKIRSKIDHWSNRFLSMAGIL